MSGNIYGRSIRRTIFGSMGRYIAILAIIALGVGFFAGIKDTKSLSVLITDFDRAAYIFFRKEMVIYHAFVRFLRHPALEKIHLVHILSDRVRSEYDGIPAAIL